MKLVKILWLFLIVGLSACEPLATFEKPQPDNTKNAGRFQEKVVGTYRSVDGDELIFITHKSVIRETNYEEKTHKNDLDSLVVLQGNFLLELVTKEKTNVRLIGDSVVQHFNFQDTLLNISNGDVLRKFKGYYFLNQHYGPNRWDVTSLAFRKGFLIVKTIETPEELVKLRKITNTIADSCVIFNPTKKQFRQFIKQNGFGSDEVYYSVN